MPTSKKWADFIVTGICRNKAKTRIEYYEVRPDEGDTLGAATMWSVEDVALYIIFGLTFVTATYSKFTRSWDKGAPVELSLRTHRDRTAADNLENLPEV